MIVKCPQCKRKVTVPENSNNAQCPRCKMLFSLDKKKKQPSQSKNK